ncbi:MAG TPA: sulfurtransferase TusA family protein [Bacillota bacterium]|nr:sulfurtransferase TusA family protein [Clostridiaceae bacterium]HNR04411.1 sulfurtransferase TusA family protein [Bacillota bacterium]HNT03422.1 sulfurtransferase TusA family protein [Bacillota bacterium]HPA53613.1 sulfurtransferase TusA family protein [Bacillota bacterium]HPL98645.1 sulfurtransferase TusA family protein [Bacillota bacterium]
MKTIDTCGMSCPQPVLMTKKALDEEKDGIDVIVDNNTAKGNVQRYLKSVGYSVEIEENDGTFVLKARK